MCSHEFFLKHALDHALRWDRVGQSAERSFCGIRRGHHNDTS